MAQRVMFVQLKTGFDTDRGPAWISWVRFTRTWKTAYWHERTLCRQPGLFDANFVDADSGEQYWLSGPHRDRADTRYSNVQPQIDADADAVYRAFLNGASLPSRDGNSVRNEPGLYNRISVIDRKGHDISTR